MAGLRSGRSLAGRASTRHRSRPRPTRVQLVSLTSACHLSDTTQALAALVHDGVDSPQAHVHSFARNHFARCTFHVDRHSSHSGMQDFRVQNGSVYNYAQYCRSDSGGQRLTKSRVQVALGSLTEKIFFLYCHRSRLWFHSLFLFVLLQQLNASMTVSISND